MQDSSNPSDQQPVFHRDGDLLVPGPLATGPWYEGSQHGSAMLGLLARAIELHPSQGPMQITRLTVDLMRAAPMAPVTTRAHSRRTGKTVEVVEAELQAGGETYARASAMRFRVTDLPVTPYLPERYGDAQPMVLCGPEQVPNPEGLAVAAENEESFYFALEMRPSLGREGPAIWIRIKNPLVEGEALTPGVRAAISADWVYAVPTVYRALTQPGLPPEPSFSFINPDASVNLHRPVEGEWIGLDAHVYFGQVGAGTAIGLLCDERGPVGHASQSILLRGPEKRPDSRQSPDAETR